MQTLAEIKELLEAGGMRPKRSLGQNFLIDHNLIRKLVDASGVGAGDLVLEVGPGTGTMTEELLARGCRVVACELDDALAALLRERLGGGEHADRFTLVHRDCLEGKHALAPELVRALDGPFSLVANLPYGAATPLLVTLLLDHRDCARMAVTVQRELADRLMAAPGSKDYGPATVAAQVFAVVERIAKAPPECFWPRPEVHSALVMLTRRSEPLTRDSAGLSAVLKDLFAHRRKQIGGVLGPEIDWGAVGAAPGCAGIVPTLRAEQLTPAQIVAFGRAVGRIAG